MPNSIRIKERERDENLGIIKKEIKFSYLDSIITPNKSISPHYKDWIKTDSDKLNISEVNEVSCRIDSDKINLFDVSGSSLIKDIRRRYIPNKVNLLIPHLRIQNDLTQNQVNSLSQFIYVASDSTIILPTIDFSYLKEYKDEKMRTKIFSERRVERYLNLIKVIIQNINAVGNGKPYIGTIPLMSIKYIRPLLKLYQDEGINSFIIDAGTADILGTNLFEFRTILLEINNSIIPLNESLIYASNLGFSLYKKNWTLADDFLSLFIYVDILGGTFKNRGFSITNKNYIPKAKSFSRSEYIYNITNYKDAENNLNIPNLNRIKLKDFNEKEQVNETQNLKTLIGETNLKNYLLQKRPILQEQITFKKISEFSEKVKIKT